MTNEKKALITVLTDNSLAQFRLQLIRILLSDDEKHEPQMQIPQNDSREGVVYFLFNNASKETRIGASFSPEKRYSAHLSSNDSAKVILEINTKTPFELEKTFHKMFQHRHTKNSWYRLTNMEINLIKKYQSQVEKIAEELNSVKYDNYLGTAAFLRFLSVSKRSSKSRKNPICTVFSRFLAESFNGQCDFCVEELVLRLEKWDNLSYGNRKTDIKQLIPKVRERFLLIDESKPIFRAVNQNCYLKYELINGRLYKARS